LALSVAGDRIEYVQSVYCADPQRAKPVQAHGDHNAVAQAGRFGNSDVITAERLTVETIQAVFGGKPHESFVVLEHRRNGTLRKAISD